MISVNELREHCERQLDKFPETSKHYQEHKIVLDLIDARNKYAWHDLRKNLEDLPPVETEVEVVCDNGYRIIITHGIYEDGSKHTEESEWFWYDIDCYGTYCEETDDYIIPEGWWEYMHYNCDECYNNVIDDKIIAWRYIKPFEEV